MYTFRATGVVDVPEVASGIAADIGDYPRFPWLVEW
jgi:hypothetical protein